MYTIYMYNPILFHYTWTILDNIFDNYQQLEQYIAVLIIKYNQGRR